MMSVRTPFDCCCHLSIPHFSQRFLYPPIHYHSLKKSRRIFWGRNDRPRYLPPCRGSGYAVRRTAATALANPGLISLLKRSSASSGPCEHETMNQIAPDKAARMAAIHKSSTSPSRYPVKKPHNLRSCFSLPFACDTAAAWLCAFCAFLRLMFQPKPGVSIPLIFRAKKPAS
jgi:hypothetical protein